jgi:hypothetical protein
VPTTTPNYTQYAWTAALVHAVLRCVQPVYSLACILEGLFVSIRGVEAHRFCCPPVVLAQELCGQRQQARVLVRSAKPYSPASSIIATR